MQNLIRRVALAMFVATMIASCAGHGAEPPARPTPTPTPHLIAPFPTAVPAHA